MNQQRILAGALRTPLIPLDLDSASTQIFLKLENLQPTGSFKVRGAGNALALANPNDIAGGVWTASAGNMAQAVAWYAKKLHLNCTVIVPEDAPTIKLKAISRLAANIISIPFTSYQALQRSQDAHSWIAHNLPDGFSFLENAYFIHPFNNPAVMAGNGAVGLEILEDIPDVNVILVPYGGGGLSCGIAAALRAHSNFDHVQVIACEVDTAAPLSASLAAGHPVDVPYTPTFISGIGAPFVFDSMWPLASQLLSQSIVVSIAQVSEAIRIMLERCHIISEGAGAVSLAAALSGSAGNGKIACVISGGNLEPTTLTQILEGYVPD